MSGWIAVGACAGDRSGTDAPLPVQQGVVIGHRTADGEPVLEGKSFLGGSRPTDPSTSGFVFYHDLPPGRLSVSHRLPGHAVGYASPEIVVGAASLASLVPRPIDATSIDDPQVEGEVAGDGFTVAIPPGALVAEDLPLDGAYTFGADRVRAADRTGVPADLLAIRDDVDISRIVIDELLVVRATQGESEVTLAEDAHLSVVVELDPGSPLLAPDAVAGLYQFSGSTTYWSYGGKPEIDAVAHTATFERGSLGWWAIGRERPEGGSCVRGSVVDENGDPLDGAEVTLTEPGTVGVDRVTTTDGGKFCLPIAAESAPLTVVGVSGDETRLYRYSGTAARGPEAECGNPLCADLGALTLDVYPDEDGDGAWSGPGGDCDDSDPEVNPHPAFGDGSYCGSSL